MQNSTPAPSAVATLVIGGAGFIGSHTVEALLARGDEVRVLDDLSTGRSQNLPTQDPNLELMVGDTLDPCTVREAMKGMRRCLHLAARAPRLQAAEAGYEVALCNILGFLNVLEAACEHGIERLVYASSAAIYGDSERLPLSENTPPRPVNPAGIEKLVAEAYAGLYRRQHGLKTLGLRYFNIYGPRQTSGALPVSVISRFAQRLGRGRAPVVYGDGLQTRDFVHVADATRANLAALGSDYCGVCNVASGQSVDLLQLAELLGDSLHTQVRPSFAPSRSGEIRYSCGDDRRMRRHLGLRVRRLDEGLSELAEQWAFRHPQTPVQA